MRRELAGLADTESGAIPALIGEIEELKAHLLRKLLCQSAPLPDVLWDAQTVAERMGCSTAFIYKHQHELGGVRVSEKLLRFRASAVERFIQRREL